MGRPALFNEGEWEFQGEFDLGMEESQEVIHFLLSKDILYPHISAVLSSLESKGLFSDANAIKKIALSGTSPC